MVGPSHHVQTYCMHSEKRDQHSGDQGICSYFVILWKKKTDENGSPTCRYLVLVISFMFIASSLKRPSTFHWQHPLPTTTIRPSADFEPVFCLHCSGGQCLLQPRHPSLRADCAGDTQTHRVKPNHGVRPSRRPSWTKSAW